MNEISKEIIRKTLIEIRKYKNVSIINIENYKIYFWTIPVIDYILNEKFNKFDTIRRKIYNNFEILSFTDLFYIANFKEVFKLKNIYNRNFKNYE